MDVADHARTGYIGRKADVEHNLGSYGVRLYDAELGRFTSVDPLWGEHYPRGPYHYALNSPISLCDDSGLDSAQRTQMVTYGLSYLGSGSTYKLGAKGEPGRPVDCSGLVDNSLIHAGEPSTLHRVGAKGTGVQRIEQFGQKVAFEDAQPGHAVTFRTGNSWGFHTGLITAVVKDEKGKVTGVDFVHASSKQNGPTMGKIVPLKGGYWARTLYGVYKMDTKPEAVDPEPDGTTDKPQRTKDESHD